MVDATAVKLHCPMCGRPMAYGAFRPAAPEPCETCAVKEQVIADTEPDRSAIEEVVGKLAQAIPFQWPDANPRWAWLDLQQAILSAIVREQGRGRHRELLDKAWAVTSAISACVFGGFFNRAVRDDLWQRTGHYAMLELVAEIMLAAEPQPMYKPSDVAAYLNRTRAARNPAAVASDTPPRPTVPQPDLATLELWHEEGGCEATDGCWVEPDGICEHGHVSWLRYLCLI